MSATLQDGYAVQLALAPAWGWLGDVATVVGGWLSWGAASGGGGRRLGRRAPPVDVGSERRLHRRRERRGGGWRSRFAAGWRHLWRSRDTDPLTGFANRSGFQRRLETAVTRFGAEAQITVLVVDLDAFAPLNDSVGSVAGDRLLRHVARRLRKCVGTSDQVGRLGGHAFAVYLVGDRGASEIAGTARQFMSAVSAPMTSGDRILALSCSVGAAMSPLHGDWSRLIGNAEAAVAAAKRAGGATFLLYAPRMKTNPSEALSLQHDLRRALDRGQLHLCYQPKVHARTQCITGVEALLRWQHPVRGLLGPEIFIPVAERFGLIGALGAWVLDATCRQVRDWDLLGLRMPTSINVSVYQLRQDDLAQRLRQAVETHGIDPALLTLEITESVAMDDAEATRVLFHELAQLGVALSIDDFGTGYSSLSYLRKLPATQLKIDQSFVHDLEHCGDARAVIDAVVRLAQALGLSVVAEGVETDAQRRILVDLGCDELQGYLFAKPMTAEAIADWALAGDGPAHIGFAPEILLQRLGAAV